MQQLAIRLILQNFGIGLAADVSRYEKKSSNSVHLAILAALMVC